MIRIGIAEDQAIVRESLAIVLGLEHDLAVVWTAVDGAEALEKALDNPVDIILMDLRLPVLDGSAATRQIRSRRPDTSVLVLTTFHQDEWLLDALQAGATACFLKDVPPSLLAEAIRRIQVDNWIPSEWASEWRLYAPEIQFRRMGATAASSATATHGLTSRDLDILRLLCLGATNHEIAAKLHLSEGTVKNYVSTLYAKLGVRHRAEAVRQATEKGLV